MLILGLEPLDADYDGPIADGEEECGGMVIGGVHETPQFCDPETGELYPEGEATNTNEEPADAADSSPSGLCDGNFAPPYVFAIIPSGLMLQTQILGPLDTPYYYHAVTGMLDIAADGTFTMTAQTIRYRRHHIPR